MVVDRDNSLGIYVSIPFCRSKCTYCNFASGVYPASEHTRYIDRLIHDLAATGPWAAQLGVDLPRRVDTVYLGGGTPSLLAPDLLANLFAAMRSQFDLDPDAEITVECAPGQLPGETLAALVAAGVNRVSLGVQSFIDAEAHASGRLHSSTIVAADLARLRAAGITNLNVDLIAGLAGQTFDSWQQSLNILIDSAVPHASVYMLEVDEDSRLGREMLSGGARYRAGLVPSDDAIAQMYSTAVDQLNQAALPQYEISNFSRPGFESRHNLRYWQRRPYLGLGLDASSMLRATPEKDEADGPRYVLRSTTTDELNTFLDGPAPPETAWLSPLSQHEEAWFLGLRLNGGVAVAALQREFGLALVAPALEVVIRLAETGLLTHTRGKVRLTAQGRLLSNDVFQEFLALEPDRQLTTANAR
jgi:oxygen-independent coproporphyrinogen-3 oxidase